jgi:hypothetical protein
VFAAIRWRQCGYPEEAVGEVVYDGGLPALGVDFWMTILEWLGLSSLVYFHLYMIIEVIRGMFICSSSVFDGIGNGVFDQRKVMF